MSKELICEIGLEGKRDNTSLIEYIRLYTKASSGKVNYHDIETKKISSVTKIRCQELNISFSIIMSSDCIILVSEDKKLDTLLVNNNSHLDMKVLISNEYKVIKMKEKLKAVL